MVAGGGGGALYDGAANSGGAGGGLIGYSGIGRTSSGSVGSGGTQIGSSFGESLSGTSIGGGGWYSGGRGWSGNAGGGSSFISGHTGCVAIISAIDSSPKTECITGTTNNDCSRHHSGMVFSNTVMIDGNGFSWSNTIGNKLDMPNPDGGFMTGNSDSGFARITRIS